MNTPESFKKRRRYLVNLGIQLPVVFFIFFVTLAIVAFHTWLTYARVSRALLTGGKDIPLATLLAQDVIATLVVMAGFIAVMGIRGSHKLAGPLYRFSQVLKKVQKGDISDQFTLRKGDLLVEFAEDLNLALANLREIVATDRIALGQAQRMLMDVRNRAPYPEIQAHIDQALKLLATVGTKFELDPEWRRAPSDRPPPEADRSGLRRVVMLPPPAIPVAGPVPPPAASPVVPQAPAGPPQLSPGHAQPPYATGPVQPAAWHPRSADGR